MKIILFYNIDEFLLQPGDVTVKVKMCGTLEFMSPEVMNCTEASSASGEIWRLECILMTLTFKSLDMWGIGVIAYLLVSGGVSPFWAGSRYRIMSRILKCDYNFEQPNFSIVSSNATDFISKLLRKYFICWFLKLKCYQIKPFSVANPKDRSTASECLQHPWLTHIGLTDGLR